MADLVPAVVAEMAKLDLGAVLLWGHSSGSAFALETASQLEQRGIQVERVFVGAQLLGTSVARRAGIEDLMKRSNRELAAALSRAVGYAQLGELDALRAEQHIGSAYRHDCLCAHRYFAEALENPPADKLSAPITVVVANDDPATAGFATHYGEWGLLSHHVDLYELSDGGHYFTRTRAAQVAQAVRRTIGVAISI
jgi:surfactin synthase thioesterase subunit